ncbi:high-affinity choline transporter 1 [Hydra vulgaris]|uniref:high-affinity choline transporter 1 n=1 Tax=Hydra vulgaris TaxID=6087 RepID=UPI00019271D0|nr:high-affinity choline transporter 1 [Hydra vulgaris]
MVNVPGLISILIFYALIFFIGLWAARKKKTGKGSKDDELLLAGRNIGYIVGAFTMTATWVGGGYINGTAESVYLTGLVSAQAPWGYALSLVFGGILFAKKLREANYVTMLDPLQEKYGTEMGAILYIPALLGEIFWSAAILSSLGATLSIILGLRIDYAVIISALIAVGYTFFGGLYSVAYTDVVQLICIFFGLWITVPFAMTHAQVHKLANTRNQWIGNIESRNLGVWLDSALLLVFGGIPWQVYFQRVLSAKSVKSAQVLSYSAAVGCIIMSVPSILIGAVAKSTDWKKVLSDNSTQLTADGVIADSRLVLPMVLYHLTPTWASFFGLGAVSAAVMSSADSSVLSASSMFGNNIYKVLIRRKASSKEFLWVIRIGIIVVGVIATLMGLTITNIYDLWVLSSDLVYVCLFPQLLCAVYIKFVNVYGSAAAFVLAVSLRTLGGEKVLGIPIVIKYPYFNNGQQLFPFKTFTMICSLITLVVVSIVANYLSKHFSKTSLSTDTDVILCSYKDDDINNVKSFSQISRWSGSYNNITASATELRNRDERLLLKHKSTEKILLETQEL